MPHPSPSRPAVTAKPEGGSRPVAVVQMLAAAMLFGTTGTAQAFLPGGTSPLAVGAVRQALGGSLLLVIGIAWWLRHAGRRWPQWSGKVGWVLLGGASVMLFQATFFYGTRGIGVAVGTVIALGSSPLFAGLFDRLRGHRPSPAWLAATGLAVTGIVLLSGAAGRAVPLSPLPVLAAIVAGAAYAGYAVSAAALVQNGVEALPATSAVIGASGLIGAVILPFTDTGWVGGTNGAAVALWLGGVTVVLSYLLMGSALRSLPAATAITLGLAEPMTAAILGVAVLGEALAPLQLAGVALVLGGVVIAGIGPAARRPPSGDLASPPEPGLACPAHRRRGGPVPSFTTTLVQNGNNVGIEVPEEVVLGFGAGKRVPVVVTLNGYSYPSTIAVMGGRYLVPLAAVHREAAGVAGGETHEVTLVHDTAPRETAVPDDLGRALAAAGLRATFDALAPSHRKEHVRAVTDAKTDDTRRRRIEKVVQALS